MVVAALVYIVNFSSICLEKRTLYKENAATSILAWAASNNGIKLKRPEFRVNQPEGKQARNHNCDAGGNQSIKTIPVQLKRNSRP